MKFVQVKEKVCGFLSRHPTLSVGAVGVGTLMATTPSAFAASPTDSLQSVAITTDMLTPLIDGVVSNIGVILPIGIALLAIFIGIRMIPKVIGMFFG